MLYNKFNCSLIKGRRTQKMCWLPGKRGYIMNKIYKVVWSKVKNCYVVVSEIAKNVITGSVKSAKVGNSPMARGLALGAVMAFMITGNVSASISVNGNPLTGTDYDNAKKYISASNGGIVDIDSEKYTDVKTANHSVINIGTTGGVVNLSKTDFKNFTSNYTKNGNIILLYGGTLNLDNVTFDGQTGWKGVNFINNQASNFGGADLNISGVNEFKGYKGRGIYWRKGDLTFEADSTTTFTKGSGGQDISNLDGGNIVIEEGAQVFLSSSSGSIDGDGTGTVNINGTLYGIITSNVVNFNGGTWNVTGDSKAVSVSGSDFKVGYNIIDDANANTRAVQSRANDLVINNTKNTGVTDSNGIYSVGSTSISNLDKLDVTSANRHALEVATDMEISNVGTVKLTATNSGNGILAYGNLDIIDVDALEINAQNGHGIRAAKDDGHDADVDIDVENLTINAENGETALKTSSGAAIDVEATVSATVKGNIEAQDTSSVGLTISGGKSSFTGAIKTAATAKTGLTLNDNAAWNVTGTSVLTNMSGNSGVIAVEKAEAGLVTIANNTNENLMLNVANGEDIGVDVKESIKELKDTVKINKGEGINLTVDEFFVKAEVEEVNGKVTTTIKPGDDFVVESNVAVAGDVKAATFNGIDLEDSFNSKVDAGVASGFGATAIGNDDTGSGATASGTYSIAIGEGIGFFGYMPGAVASGDKSIAIGTVSKASGEDSVAVGSFAQATGRLSAAYGSASKASGETSVAIGYASEATHDDSVAIGYGSVTSAENTVSFGSEGNERVLQNVAAGTLDTDVANVGQLNKAIDDVTNGYTAADEAIQTALDKKMDNNATGIDAIALGNGAVADKMDNIAIGDGAASTGNMSMAVGAGVVSSGQAASIAIGGGDSWTGFTTASGSGTVAIGYGAQATGYGSVAIGGTPMNAAIATHKNAIAIGAGSVTTMDNSVSFGSEGNERVLQNVAAGTLDTDAANVGQLKAATKGIATETWSGGDVTSVNGVVVSTAKDVVGSGAAINGKDGDYVIASQAGVLSEAFGGDTKGIINLSEMERDTAGISRTQYSGTTTGETKVTDDFVVDTKEGKGSVTIGYMGENEMLFTTNDEGKYTFGVNAQTGEMQVNGGAEFGKKADGTYNVEVNDEGVAIQSGMSVAGGKFDVSDTGKVTATNGMKVQTTGKGNVVVGDINGNTMLYTTGENGYVFGVEANTGNIETKGTLRVANDNFVVDTLGNTAIKGSLSVYKDVKVSGGLEAGTNVIAADDVYADNGNISLKDTAAAIGTAATDISELEAKTAGISRTQYSGTTTGETKVTDDFVVDTKEGKGSVTIGYMGENEMLFTTNDEGKYTFGVNAQTGEMQVNGGAEFGKKADGTYNVEVNDEGVAIQSGMSVAGGKFDVSDTGKVTATNGMKVQTTGKGNVVVGDINGNTMLYTTGENGYVFGVEANTGNIETKGTLRVANDNFVVDTLGNTAIKGSLSVYKDVKVSGGLEAGTNVIAADDVYADNGNISLKDTAAAIGTAATDISELEAKTAGISRTQYSGTTTGETKVTDDFVVDTVEGNGKVTIGYIGEDEMIFTTDKDGKYTFGVNAQTGEMQVNGGAEFGKKADGTYNVEINDEGVAVQSGFSVAGGKFDVSDTGKVTASNGMKVQTSGEGSFSFANIGTDETLFYAMSTDSSKTNPTIVMNAQNGNIETQGSLSVGNGAFVSDAASGNAAVKGSLAVGSDANVAGGVNVETNVIAKGDVFAGEGEEQVSLKETAKQVAVQGDKITALENASSEQSNKIGALENLTTEHSNKIGALEDLTSEHSNKIGALEDLTSEQSNKIGALEDLTSEHSNKIGALENLTAEQGNKITALENSDKEQSNKITALENATGEQSGKITALENASAEQAGKITALENDSAEQSGKITALEGLTSEHTDKITALENDSAEQSGKITALENSDAVQNTAIAKNSEAISGLNQRLGKMNGKINKVGAGAAALAALHPLEYDPDDKLTFSAGVGNYNGENAAALGAFYRPDEKLMFSLGGTMGNGENMVNLGVSIGLDGAKGGAKLSKKELIQKVSTMEAENAAIKAENDALEDRVAKLEALVAKLAEK